MKHYKTPLSRFIRTLLSIPDRSTCWNWPNRLGKNGYGLVWLSDAGAKTFEYAHRFSYQAFYGETPKDLFVCHSCDNRACVNPDHLFLGTNKENIQDALKKHRPVGRTKLNPDLVRKIRKMYAIQPKTYKEMGKLFGVQGTTIKKVVKRESWLYV
jgi:hypothetical protein